MGKVNVLGVDPGFSSVGLAVVRLDGFGGVFVEKVDVIRTKKSGKKKNIREMDDDFRRSCEIVKQFRQVLNQWKPMAIVAEEFSLVRNSSVSAKIVRVWGILAALKEVYSLPIVPVWSVDVKYTLCGSKSASKKEVQSALLGRFPYSFQVFMDTYPKTVWEHGFDAAGIAVAGLGSDVICAIRSSCS